MGLEKNWHMDSGPWPQAPDLDFENAQGQSPERLGQEEVSDKRVQAVLYAELSELLGQTARGPIEAIAFDPVQRWVKIIFGASGCPDGIEPWVFRIERTQSPPSTHTRQMAHPNRSKRALAGTGNPAVVHVFGIRYSVSHVYASQLGAQRTWDIIQGNMQRRRLMMPPHPVLAQLAWEVLSTPPPDEEIHLLTEVVGEAQEQNLEPAEIETRLRGTASGTV